MSVPDSGRRRSTREPADRVRFTGRKMWPVQLARGRYRFGSDPKRLEGTLRVR
jgi:hypothetical protein